MTGSPVGGALKQIHHLFAEGTAVGLPDGQLLERFLARGDDSAFAALVQRHGAMVLGICRSILRNPADAEDAFQATFLVLVSKGRSIRGQETLGGWLRQVAHRIAVQAGADAVRRRARERRTGVSQDDERRNDDLPEDWRQVLHEELATLSEKHRLPLLLCDLEGKTHAQAAAELGCGPATVQRRLNGARALLRSRLIRRGIAPTAGVLAASLGHSASAQIPRGWVEATLRAAESLGSRAGRLAVGDVTSTAAAALASKSLRAMMLSQFKTAAAAAVFLVTLVGVVWGVGLAAQEKAGPGAAPRMPKAPAAPAAVPDRARAVEPAEPGETIGYQGRVLDPDGKPFAGAAVYLVSYDLKHSENPPIRATSDADGRFRFDVPKSDFDTSLEDRLWSYGTILARAPGLAFGLANADATSKELTLRLAPDDVPISGRIIDLQGRPVAGATVTVLSVRATSSGRLDDYLKVLQERNEVFNLGYPFQSMDDQPEPPVIPPARTDADGRFRIAGIGRDRVAKLQIEGPTIETRRVMARTRPGATLRVPAYKDVDQPEMITIYGATFEHVAGPTRPIEGVVRDLETGRPLAGIMVHGERNLEPGMVVHVYAITDAQGHYRLVGLPQGQEGHVLAIPPCDFPYSGRGKARLKVPPDENLPYPRARVPVGHSGGPGPVHLDIPLKRGVWVTGRLIDRGTQKPVSGQVEYLVFGDNPHLRAYPDFRLSPESTMIVPHFMGTDGVFHLVAFPGPGVLAARADARAERSEYIRAAGVEKIQGRHDEYGFLYTQPYKPSINNYNVLDPIDPAPGTGSLTRDLLLETGRSLAVTVLGQDGKPSTNLVAAGLKELTGWEEVPPGTSNVEVVGLAPGHSRTVGFRDNPKRLVGELVLRGDETRPQTVTLQPWGVLTGRIVDADGQPAADGILCSVVDQHGTDEKIGPDGRFRIDGLIPGKLYDLDLLSRERILRGSLAVAVKLGPGETRDLGDVTPKRPEN
jgi:RNA polymerase sigma factor (sigma-70 family)